MGWVGGGGNDKSGSSEVVLFTHPKEGKTSLADVVDVGVENRSIFVFAHPHSAKDEVITRLSSVARNNNHY